MEMHHSLTRIHAKIKNAQFKLSRNILFLWIKPTFLGSSKEFLGLNDSDLVCYVLPFKSTVDLLVVDMACKCGEIPSPVSKISHIGEDRAVFFLGRPEGKLGRKSLRQQSHRLPRLFAHQRTLNQRSIKIVPISLFWGHQPDREKSALKLLLSDNWSVTSGLKKLFSILFHPRHILVQFGQPIALNALTSSKEEQPRQIRKLLRLLRVGFNNQKQAIIGPDLSHRRTLINTILASDRIQKAIENETGEESGPISAEVKAKAYAREIAADQSYRVVRFFHVLLSWLWNNLYAGIEVNHVEVVKDTAQSNEIVYIPCHRSHIDYLLLSYVLYENGLALPHIAAGINLNLPLIGPLLRRAGAFFMRRSFQEDELYKAIFDEYLHQIFSRGFSVEYFIEGGRSRSGRTLFPRTGMLRMTLSNFHRDSKRPIVFIPVYFGYERVLEATTYMAELSGKDKESESVFDIFEIFRSLRHDFGQVTVNFGSPVPLKEFIDDNIPEWQSLKEIPPIKLSETSLNLANMLAMSINKAVAIKSTDLIALALLATSKQNIEEEYLLKQVELLRQIARTCIPAGASVTSARPEEMLNQAMKIVGLSRIEHAFGSIISSSKNQSRILAYNANNVAHVYTLPSLVLRFVTAKRQTDKIALLEFVTTLYPFLKSEMFLSWAISELNEVLETIVHLLQELGLVTTNGQQLSMPSQETSIQNSIQHIASITDQPLTRFYTIMELLQQSIKPTLKNLESASASISEKLSILYGINSTEFFDKSLFSTFLRTLKSENLLRDDLTVKKDFSLLVSMTAQSLDPDIRYNIFQAVKKFEN